MQVLITGGTGFFGKGMVSNLLQREDISRICVFSRDEYKQALMRRQFNDDRMRWFVGDVRDKSRLTQAMNGIDLVVHAAALKRVEVGEYNPTEMIKTNVLGSMNVIDAATHAGVKKVVALSSDKACAPLNCYGATKLTSEKLFISANNTRGADGPIFSVVRYGNVSGSTGSIIPTWQDMIASGRKKVPVTDIECTRFWMELEEAVQLVMWTAENMLGGELVVPNLPAYRVGDLAVAMGADIYEIGLGPGEKMHEQMISQEEAPSFTAFDDSYFIKYPSGTGNCSSSLTSNNVRRMSIEEIKGRLLWL